MISEPRERKKMYFSKIRPSNNEYNDFYSTNLMDSFLYYTLKCDLFVGHVFVVVTIKIKDNKNYKWNRRKRIYLGILLNSLKNHVVLCMKLTYCLYLCNENKIKLFEPNPIYSYPVVQSTSLLNHLLQSTYTSTSYLPNNLSLFS